MNYLSEAKFALAALVIVALAAIPGVAQSTAQINGSVKDQTGAVLPGVEVTATQTATGAVRTVVTDETGLFVLPSLAIGPYMVEATLPGFRSYVQTGIVLQVNSSPVIPIVLEVGQVSEQIEVSADAALVETQSSSIGTVVDNQRILEMPLNGRNVTELIFLAGMATPAGALNSVRNYPTISISVAGGTGLGVTYTLDGTNHNDAYNNLNLPMPFPDALQEFKVETSALPAQYGFHSSAAVNAVTKSGTNEFHGNVFEFLRNGKLNARNFFAASRDTLKRNQFGGTLGGPIIQNKLFFFGGYQGTTQRSEPTATIAYVPTPAMLAGDFRAVASPACAGRQINLSTALGFQDNQIDTVRFSPAALIIARRLPTSTDPCGKVNYGLRSNSDEHMGLGRIDYQHSEKQSYFGRLYVTNLNQPSTYDGTNALTVNTAFGHFRVYSLTLGQTYLLGNGVVSSLRVGANRVDAPKIPDNFATWQDLGVNASSFLAPTIRLSATGNGFSIGSGSSIYGLANTGPNYNVSDDITWIKGSHQFGFGGSYIKILLNSKTGLNATGNFSFNGTQSGAPGLSLADFMLGRAVTWSQGNLAQYYNRSYDIALYAQDSWKVTPRLTLNYGVRWEPFLPFYSKYGWFSHFDQENFDNGVRSTVYVNAPPGDIFPGDAKWESGKSLANNRFNEFLPRFGLSWDVQGNGKTIIRAAIGRLNDRINLLAGTPFAQNAPFGNNISLANVDLANPWANYAGGTNPLPLALTKDIIFPTFGSRATVPFDWKPMTLNQWNLSIQRQVGTDWLLSMNYVGNNTSHLLTSSEENPAIYIPGQCITGQYGLAAPGACSTTANTNSRRRLILQNPEFGRYYSVVARWDDGGTGSYHGLYVAAQKRLGNGMSLLTNYTWSHCISDAWNQFPGNSAGSAGQPGNRRAERGDCATSDTRHVFNLSGIFQTPQFTGRTMQLLAGGWQFSPILRLRSGPPFSVTTGVDNALSGTGGQRASRVFGEDPYLENKSIDGWLNPAAFTSPATGTYGNQGANTLRGPGIIQIDLGISRTFNLAENKTLQIRAESFNLPNHTNPNPPVSATNSGATFGKIQGAGDPRIIQFGMKFVY